MRDFEESRARVLRLRKRKEASILLLRSAALIVGVPYGLSRTLNGV